METNLDNEVCHSLKENITWNDLFRLLSTSFLPQQNSSLDEPLEANLFKEHVKNCETNFKKALLVLEKQCDSASLNKKLAISIILLCGEHSKPELWTSPQTLNYSVCLLKLVIAQYKCSNVADLLLQCKHDHVLAELRPKLLKDSWKNNPAAVSCFSWILSHIKRPHLGEVLSIVLPTCLLLVDDHEYDNKIKGLQCLQHIANNVSRAELNQYGRGSVIYNALEHMIYLREPEIIPPLAACLTALLSKTEHRSNTETISWSHFDDVLNIWLPSMEMEQKLLLREVYIESLNSLLTAMGLACVRWSKKLLSIVSEYGEQDHTRDKALMTLQTFIQITWPRLSTNFQEIVFILMKIVIKLSKNIIPNSSSECTLKAIKDCFNLLETSCKEKYDTFINEIKDCHEMKDYFLFLSECLRES